MSNDKHIAVPEIRIRRCNDAPIRKGRSFILYWMIANRRLHSNFGFQRAVELALQKNLPIVVLEALRIGYPWASDRLHSFVIDGMRDKLTLFPEKGIRYYPYVERSAGADKGLLSALAKEAAVVVTDDYPCFFLPRMLRAAAAKIDACFEAVDGNGILPMRSTDRVFETAYSFRRYLQKSLRPHLAAMPVANPLKHYQENSKVKSALQIDSAITRRWPLATEIMLGSDRAWLKDLEIDHTVAVSEIQGGIEAGHRQVLAFVSKKLDRYGEERSEPSEDVASGLSPYLHFGHVSAHEIVERVFMREKWSMENLSETTSGSKAGWWGLSPSAEAFLDELITWRELGFNFCFHRSDYEKFGSLPDWAKATLEKHSSDVRVQKYTLREFEEAKTHDELWNAAQTQLIAEGRIHNYLRMLWGKKILEWSPSPQKSLENMIELNNKYAIDGRDPNSYSGIFWTLGRYDRPWGPERPIFGTIRYMSSENTARKFDVKPYLAKYSAQPRQKELF